MNGINVAIVGATGLVGQTFLKVLEERKFPIKELYCFASSRSAGKTIEFKGKTYVVEELTEQSFDREIDIALFFCFGNNHRSRFYDGGCGVIPVLLLSRKIIRYV